MIPEVEDEQSVLALVLQQGGFPEAWAQAPRQGWGGAIRDRLREWEGTGEGCAGRGLQRHPCAGRRGGRWGGVEGMGGWRGWGVGDLVPREVPSHLLCPVPAVWNWPSSSSPRPSALPLPAPCGALPSPPLGGPLLWPRPWSSMWPRPLAPPRAGTAPLKAA